MRPFQTSAKTAVEEVLREWNLQLCWQEVGVGPLAVLAYGAEDVDLHAQFELDGQPFEIWLHPDDLSLASPGMNRILESQDYPRNPGAQIDAFCRLLRESLPDKRPA